MMMNVGIDFRFVFFSEAGVGDGAPLFREGVSTAPRENVDTRHRP